MMTSLNKIGLPVVLMIGLVRPINLMIAMLRLKNVGVNLGLMKLMISVIR